MRIFSQCEQQYHLHLNKISADEEIDGECLMGLTESMVASVFPSMKLQVRFLQARKKLETGRYV